MYRLYLFDGLVLEAVGFAFCEPCVRTYLVLLTPSSIDILFIHSQRASHVIPKCEEVKQTSTERRYMNGDKFQTLQPWPDLNDNGSDGLRQGAADGNDVARKISKGEGHQDTNRSTNSPSKLVTIDLLESLSHNPSNISLLFEVAKAELESIGGRLAVQVARCGELEEERAGTRDSDNEDRMAALNENIETLTAELHDERRSKMDMGVQIHDLKKELSESRKLLEAQDLELARDEEASRSAKAERSKEVQELEKRLEESQKAYQDLQEKNNHLSTALQEAHAMRDNPWVEYERVRCELEETRTQLKAAKTIQKTLETDVDAAQTAIVELSSQMENQLNELEELRSINAGHQDQARKLEQESAMHEELSAICDEQAMNIVRLKEQIVEKDLEIAQQKERLEGMKQDLLDQGDCYRKDRDLEVAKTQAELVSALALLNQQTAKLERANAERERLRANAENERNEKMARLKGEYKAAASARATANHEWDSCPLAGRISRLASRRSRKVGVYREMSGEEDKEGRAIIDLDCVDDSVCAWAAC